MEETIRVLFCQTGRPATWIEIENTAVQLAHLVPNAEEYYPFDEEVALLCSADAETKPVNRILVDANGQLMAEIRGDFLLAYAPVESPHYQNFPSKEWMEKYENLFRDPRNIVMIPSDMDDQ